MKSETHIPAFEELNRIKETYEKADPTKYSTLDEGVTLESTNNKRIPEKEGSGYFYKLREVKHPAQFSEPEVQRFVVLLSKGVLHVSDVIKKDDGWYSKDMPLENMDPGSETKREQAAEVFIVKWLFADWDKKRRNIKLGNNNFALYDFDVTFANRDELNENSQIPFDFKNHGNVGNVNNAARSVDEIMSGLGLGWVTGNAEDSPKIKAMILEKLELFKGRLQDEVFLNAVYKKSNINLESERFSELKGENTEQKKEALKQYLLSRITLAKNTLDKKSV